MLAFTQKQSLSDETANLLLGPTLTARMQRTCYDLGHATGELTRPAVESLLCAESNLWHQGCLAIQSQRPCQGVMRHNSSKKYERRVSLLLQVCTELLADIQKS